MPTKLYIPTSTLNFNNIISSESISPYSFYQKRGYGFRRFEKVDINNFDNILLLYSNIPEFSIVDRELENYPMVIEICLESCKLNIQDLGGGIYSCDETIYLNPFDSRIYFNNKNELISTKSKAEPSIETKLVSLYDNCFRIIDHSARKEKYSISRIKDTSLNLSALQKDIRINKLKGFLYSYIIAANRSYDSNVVQLKMHFRQLINAISAIITSPDYKGYFQSDAVDKLYRSINRDFERIEGIQTTIEDIIKVKSEEWQFPNLLNFLIKEELYESFYIKIRNKHNLKSRYYIRKFECSAGYDKLQVLDAYESYLNDIATKLSTGTPCLSINKLPIIDSDLIAKIPEYGDKRFVVDLLNMYLNEMVDKESFLGGRYENARKGGAMFKTVLGESWDNSDERKYINALLKNLNEYTSFDINSTNIYSLKSFAAFFQKGDIEINKLEDYLVSNGIGDLRVAFALWGVIFGFADLPKTYTESLFASNQKEYTEDVYKYIYSQLFHINLSGQIITTNNSEGYLPGQEIELPMSHPEEENKSFIGKIFNKVKDIIKVENDEDLPIDDPVELKIIFESNEFKEIPEKDQYYYKAASRRVWADSKDVKKLYGIARRPNIGKWNKCVKLIEPAKKPKKSKEPELFTESSETHFIQSLKSVQHLTTAQKNKLTKNWEYTRKKYMYDKKGHIEFFINLCKKQGREFGLSEELYGVFDERLAQTIKDEIEKRY